MERIRVVLAELPRMLRDIVTSTIEAQHDMHVVGEFRAPAGERPAIADPGADVLVTGLEDDTLADRYERLMREHPALRVLGITGDARRAFLFELRPHRIPLGAASPDGLVDAIRAVTRCDAN